MYDSENMSGNGVRRRGSARETESVTDEVSDLVFGSDDNAECPDCKRLTVATDEALECEICENWFHIECQKITKTTYNFLLKNSRSREKSKVHWYCDRCDMGAGKILSVVTKISRRQDKMEEKMKAQEKELALVKQLTESHEHWVQTNDNKITEIQETLKNHETRLSETEQQGTALQTAQRTAVIEKPSVDERAIVTEVTSEVTKNVADRLDRQSNAILFNLAESKSNLKAEVMTHDVTRVKQLCLATAGKDVSFSCKRLGRKSLSWQTSEGDNGRSTSPGHGDNNGDDNATPNPKSNRPRPLLVQFTEPEGKAAVMKNLFKLADDEVPDNISCIRVKHDMTPEEREREKMLQLEAKQKK